MMRWVRCSVVLALVACKGLPPEPPTPVVPHTGADTADSDPVVIDETYLALPATQSVDNGRFATADTCAECHSNSSTSTAMRDASGNEVGPYDLWQASMMANAARDPIWRAVVSVEVAETPGAADLIGERCMSCHAPMGATDAQLENEPKPRYPSGLTDGSERANLGLDGASCTLCHQIEPDNLGQPSSWKGGYIVTGEQVAYGPHPNPNTSYMQAAGWTPTQASHITSAELCATCHTLITDALEPDGTPNGGSLVEQAPYLEMKNSSNATSTCQDCHFPKRGVDQSNIVTPIARNPNGANYSDLTSRTLSRHELIGGNTLVPQLFRDNHDILNPRAPAEAFDEKILRARAQLQSATAVVTIENLAVASGTLSFRAYADPLTGHKFPTGIPLRRAWMRVRVYDGASELVFISGNYDSTGRITNTSGTPLPFELAGGPIAPNENLITSEDQVQIYETVMQDIDGAPTFRLLHGAGFLKDNRLLPRGWSVTNTNIDLIAPQGVSGDPDYTTEGDRITYQIDVSGRPGPFLVEAQLLYQPLGQRWAEEIFAVETPETIALKAMLESADRRPEVIATITASHGGN
ncbi:MAG: multiheme c-type cytochrome [Myxococcota bacterium]